MIRSRLAAFMLGASLLIGLSAAASAAPVPMAPKAPGIDATAVHLTSGMERREARRGERRVHRYERRSERYAHRTERRAIRHGYY